MGLTSTTFNGPFQFPNGQFWPDGGETFYVGTSAILASLGQFANKIGDRSFTTVNAAYNACVANRWDTIACLPGYTETVSSSTQWSNIKAGVRVLGLGTGTLRPKFTWSAAAANIAISAANNVIQNCVFELAGANTAGPALTVTNNFNITGVGTQFHDCFFQCGIDGDQITSLGLLFAAADCEVWRSRFIGTTAGEITAAGTVIRLTAADRFVFRENYMSAALATDTDGLVETLTTLSLDVDFKDNYFYSNGSGSTCAVDFGAALACTGTFRNNLMVVDADGTAGTVVFTRNAANNLSLMDNNLVNDNNERGLVIGTASV